MKNRQSFLLWMLLFLGNVSVFTQHAVKGQITDAKTGEPLVGVNVVLKGLSESGTISDLNGNYSLSVSESSTLIFSYIGYVSQEVSVKGRSVVNVSLSEDVEALEEVVVIGYGTMRKRDVTGALSQVKAKDMQAITVPNPIQALQGRVPGVAITTNTGAPEGNFTIRVRGTNSIKGGGDDPLYVVDGMPVNPSSINSQDIESVEVLKDASTTAIYGSRGANGVILITTKKGNTGATSVSYDGSYGIQSLIKKMDMLDAAEWATLVNEQQLNDTGKEYFTPEQISSFGKGTDWQDLVYSNAPIQNHNLTISGGSEKNASTGEWFHDASRRYHQTELLQ
ncbi:MAG: SusC/RagA family TonB-linked outer membrane protein [Parabacteroides sp.]|nr:SusC/RagA family TonB-linked outer membrane protein [Parabacteroides sp.]